MAITRRKFLQGMGVGSAALAAACGGSGDGGATGGPGGGGGTPPTPLPADPVLVIVNLDGGNDWLNMLPPSSGANRTAYDAKRPTLGIPGAGLVDLGGGIGLSTDFTGMDELHAAGRVAWIPGIGMNNPNLSHFVSIDLWGQGSASPDGTGWLGRFADGAFSPTGDVLRGVTVTNDLPVMLKGGSRAFVSISSASGFVYPAWLRSNRIGNPFDPQLLETAYGVAVNAAPPAGASAPGFAAAASVGKLFLDAQNGFGVDGTLTARTPAVPYPGEAAYPVKKLDGSNLPSSLGNQLKLVAQMIAAGLPGQVYFTRIGGWDTHSNEATDHPNLMRTLGGSIRAFLADLDTVTTPAGKASDRVMVMGYSEFGRRVAENKGGTDHGTAGLAFCVGNAVRGGIHGTYPDLADLDKNGNMKFTVDYRSLYATVLERWLGVGAAATDASLGAMYPRLGFL
ncbi:MAG: DUF1501 domain-containing protein [Anaeromyxobacteraceae bacterium]